MSQLSIDSLLIIIDLQDNTEYMCHYLPQNTILHYGSF